MIRPAALGALTLALACGGDDDSAFQRYEPEPGTPERVAWEAGITGDLGAWEPTETTVRDAETTYTFDPADGPVCMRGAPFAMGVEERAGDELLIFLQGGGACWSDFCLAVTKAQPRIPDGDLLVERDDNPLRDHDVVYVPYCDGSLFAGDRDVDEDGELLASDVSFILRFVAEALGKCTDSAGCSACPDANGASGAAKTCEPMGTKKTCLTADVPGNSRSPSWAPDGGSVIFENNQTGSYRLYRRALSDTKAR